MKKQLGLMLVTTCSAAMLVAPQAMAEDTAQLTEARCVALVDAVKDATAKQRDAQDRERATQQTLDAAQRDVAAAQEELKAAKGMVAAAQRLLDDATTDRTAKQSAVPAGVTAESAQQALEDSKARAAEAAAALEASKAEAQQQFDRGSLGFFEAMGATDAVAELNTDFRFKEEDPVAGQTGYRIADDTHIGEADDATHLDNMKAAIGWLPEANELRESDGQPALPVSDFLMAQAQVNVNWSHQLPRGHSKNGWDNLSWNYENPFKGWFHEERVAYFEALEKGEKPFEAGAGHYMAIVNPDMRATGFAVNTKAFRYQGYSWRIAHAQTFATHWMKQGTPLFTVDEYTERFNTYYDGLKHAIEFGDATKRQTLEQREADVDKAEQTLEAARALQAAQELVAKREQELSTAKEAQPARQTAAEEALKAAKQTQEDAAAATAAAKAAAAEARANTERAEAEYQPVKANCDALTGADKEGSSTGGIIAGVVLGLLAIIGIVVATNPGILNMF